jgi:hypothetical protein
MFPQALVKLVPRLLEESISPAEALAATRGFWRGHVPSADDRQTVAAWLEEIFPGEREKDAEEAKRLLAAGIELIAPLSFQQRPRNEPQENELETAPFRSHATASRRSWVKVAGIGVVASLVLAGGAALLLTHRRGPALLAAKPDSLAAQSPPDAQPVAEPPASDLRPDVALPAPDAQPIPAPLAPDHAIAVVAPINHTRPTNGPAHRRPAKGKPQQPSAEQLLRAADAAFDSGNHIQAIKLGTRALNAGGGVGAHLALANYYRNISRHREALQHYRAAIKLDPGNAVAATGIKVVERQLRSSP